MVKGRCIHAGATGCDVKCPHKEPHILGPYCKVIRYCTYIKRFVFCQLIKEKVTYTLFKRSKNGKR